jgi:hypothetical protein
VEVEDGVMEVDVRTGGGAAGRDSVQVQLREKTRTQRRTRLLV